MNKNLYWRDVLGELSTNGGFSFVNPPKNVHWFPYTSGMIGPYYVQSMKIWRSQNGIQSMCSAFKEFPLSEFDHLTGGERRDWPFLSIASGILDYPIPCSFINKNGTLLDGEKIELEGTEKIAHIADLNNEGASLRIWDKYISEAGGKISDAFFLIDRLEDGVEVAKELRITTHAVVELDQEAWEQLLIWQKISQEVYDSLKLYWENRWEWGKEKLLAYPKDLLKLPEEKKEKILKTYDTKYPGLKDEMTKKLVNLKNEQN